LPFCLFPILILTSVWQLLWSHAYRFLHVPVFQRTSVPTFPMSGSGHLCSLIKASRQQLRKLQISETNYKSVILLRILYYYLVTCIAACIRRTCCHLQREYQPKIDNSCSANSHDAPHQSQIEDYLLKLIKNVDQVFTNLLHRRKLEAVKNKYHFSCYFKYIC